MRLLVLVRAGAGAVEGVDVRLVVRVVAANAGLVARMVKKAAAMGFGGPALRVWGSAMGEKAAALGVGGAVGGDWAGKGGHRGAVGLEERRTGGMERAGGG